MFSLPEIIPLLISYHVPDGTLNGAMYALPYDLLTDFEPVSLITTYPWLIAVRKAIPADDLKGFIAWLKANPDRASAGTSGFGSNVHLAGVLFQKETGTRFQSVPYRGSGPALQDLVAGQIDILFDGGVSVPQMRAGRIKILAVTAKNRLASAPDIPTVDEAGLPGFYVSSWQGLWVPRGTPKDIITKLNAAVVDALADASVRSRIADLGLEIVPHDQQTPAALTALQKAEIEKWWPIIKEAGIKPE
jgi:tripartite-type tricarboxylate transporter receptor subunit TctC